MLRLNILSLSVSKLKYSRNVTCILSKSSIRAFHLSLTVRYVDENVTRSSKTAKIKDKTTKDTHTALNLADNLADAFKTHDHVHMRQSETEQNDSYHLGSSKHISRILSNQPILASNSNTNISHSHGHTHAHDTNPFLLLSTEEIKKHPGVRITWIGLAINVGIALGKFVGGFVFHSQALLADSVHAASDLISDFLTLFSVKFASKKATADFPYGYGKVETVGSLAVSTILALAGVSIGWSSFCAIVGPIIPHTLIEMFSSFMGHSHGHSHGVIEGMTNINAAWIAGGSIVVKEWIFQATKKIAITTNSNVLMANAWHHRVDSLTSLVALVAITSSYFFHVQSLDALGGVLVSGLVIKAGGEGMMSAIRELTDQSLPNTDDRYIKLQDTIKDSLNKLTSNNNSDNPYSINRLTVLSSGPNLRAVVVLQVPQQKWDNKLGIDEFENVTKYLRGIVKKNVPNINKIDVEFVEEAEDNEMLENDIESHEKHHHHHTHKY